MDSKLFRTAVQHAYPKNMPPPLHRKNTLCRQNSRPIRMKPTYLDEDVLILHHKGADVDGAREGPTPFGLRALLDPTGQVVHVCKGRTRHQKCTGRSHLAVNTTSSSKDLTFNQADVISTSASSLWHCNCWISELTTLQHSPFPSLWCRHPTADWSSNHKWRVPIINASESCWWHHIGQKPPRQHSPIPISFWKSYPCLPWETL